MHKLFKRTKSKGQAVVEMALVMPFFLLIIVGGLIDFGMTVYNYITLEQIVSNTASWGAEHKKTDSEIITHIASNKPKWWNNEFKIAPIKRERLDSGGNVITLTVFYESPMFTPIYQLIAKQITNKPSLRIASRAVFKEPEFLR